MFRSIQWKMILGAIVGSLIAGQALAVNISFLRDGPVAKMSDEDFSLFGDTVEDALENGAVGESVTWSGNTEGTGGELTIREDYQKNDLPCRRLVIVTRAGGETGTGVSGLCKHPEKGWLFDNTGQ